MKLKEKNYEFFPLSTTTSYLDGIVSNNAKIQSSGRITNIGGYFDGTYSMSYYANSSGNYNIIITVTSSTPSTLALNIGDSDNSPLYFLNSPNAISTYTIPSYFFSGNNFLKFHGDGINRSPDILKIDFILISSTPKQYLYYLRNGILKNGAIIDSSTNFIDRLGGIDNGYVSINVQITEATLYNLTLQYLEESSDKELFIDVNGINTSTIYILTQENYISDDIPQTIVIPIQLEFGTNTLTFYGNQFNDLSKLGNITLSKSTISSYALSNSVYELTSGYINSPAKPSNTFPNFVEGIGGNPPGFVTIDVYVNNSAFYTLTINYISTENTENLLININGSGTGIPYNLHTTNNQPQTFITTIFLKAGKNELKFYSINNSYTPYLGQISISDTNVTSSVPYQISSVTLRNGAVKYSNTNFISSIGGKKNGIVTLLIKTSQNTFYDLSFKYISLVISRSIKVTVYSSFSPKSNIYTLSPIDTSLYPLGKTFIIPINLISGSNIVTFEGVDYNEAPIIGEFNITLSAQNSILTYNLADAILSNFCTVNKLGLVSNIGGPKDGTAILTVNVPSDNIYNLDIEYLRQSDTQALFVWINDVSTGLIYLPPIIKNWSLVNLPTFRIQASLKAGSNFIKFKGLSPNYGPLLGKITVKWYKFIPKKLPHGSYDAAEGDFSQGAGINPDNEFVTFLGGKNDGSCTITVSVENTCDYSMLIQYYSSLKYSCLTFDINNKETGELYILPKTTDTSSYREFTLHLNSGTNTIKFHGDKNTAAPDIGVIILNAIDA